jgi:hypothetical protein
MVALYRQLKEPALQRQNFTATSTFAWRCLVYGWAHTRYLPTHPDTGLPDVGGGRRECISMVAAGGGAEGAPPYSKG